MRAMRMIMCSLIQQEIKYKSPRSFGTLLMKRLSDNPSLFRDFFKVIVGSLEHFAISRYIRTALMSHLFSALAQALPENDVIRLGYLEIYSYLWKNLS